MIKLRPYQAKVWPRVRDYIKRQPGKHPLIAFPTAAGKTYSIADVVYNIRKIKPDAKIVILSHVREILDQNFKSLKKYLDERAYAGKVGLYSAGMGSRDIQPITVAGIQSAYRRIKDFEDFDVVIIDEAHLINYQSDTMYHKFLSKVGKRHIGFTATPFRLGTGYIYGNEKHLLFDDIIYDLTTLDSFNDLVEEGYLSQLIPKATKYRMDTKDIKIKAGDFSEKDMSRVFDQDFVTEMACDEIIREGANRKKWLIFAIDIDHAEHIAEYLIRKGISTNVVHSKMEFDRDKVIGDSKRGHYQALVNVNMLTTGYDDPGVDLIAMLRPTQSPVLHVQSIGRGLRVVYADGHDISTKDGRLAAIKAGPKQNCLVLDFAGNTARLGPINNVQVKKKGKGLEGGEPITKECPDCATIVHPSVKQCPVCGHEFKFEVKIGAVASTEELIARSTRNWYDVSDVFYYHHKTQNGDINMLKVVYQCGLKTFTEYVGVEHMGYAKHKADRWLQQRAIGDLGNAKDSVAILMQKTDMLIKPKQIRVDTSGKYAQVLEWR